jgi:hypothetical protein
MRVHMLTRAVVSIAALFIMVSAQAQVDSSLFQGMQWRNIGPFIAGKVDTLSGVNGRPAIAYVGTDNGGVWKTVNAGATWVPLTDAVEVVRGFTALAVAQSQPSVVYAGTGSVFGSNYRPKTAIEHARSAAPNYTCACGRTFMLPMTMRKTMSIHMQA